MRQGPRWGASVHVRLIDPGAFSGREAFAGQMAFPADTCRETTPVNPARPVRLPGEQAERNIAMARAEGVPIRAGVAAALRGWAGRLGMEAAVLD